MGGMSIFTPEQKLIFDQIKNNRYLIENFYFTGGTSLSYFYLKHRYSEDMDFFSEKEINQSILFSIVNQWAKKLDFIYESEFKEIVYIFNITFNNNLKLKLDFGFYPYTRLKREKEFEHVQIDSLTDIAVNKLATINQRSSVKDFVDLYFLLEKFSFWDLIEGVKIKFRMKIDPWVLAADMLWMIDQFTYLPRMIKPLTLNELKSFFREKAKDLSKKAVE